MTTLTIGSLFSGIGGLELGVEHATGGRVVFQVERDAWCREVLAKHWPDAVRYDDVCTVNGLPRVDILCGGFPCQDVSVAGKRAGFGGERSSLWREYRRIIADVGPRLVFVENVPGLLTADDGWAFGEVLGDLAALGFDAEWDVFRASAVGAPHRRERIFLLAYLADALRFDAQRHGIPGVVARESGAAQGEAQQRQRGWDAARGGSEDRGLADAAGLGERESADEGIALAARGRARMEPRRGGESPVADAQCLWAGEQYDADVLGRRAREAEQTRVGGGDRTADGASVGVDQVDSDGERGAERDRGAVAAAAEYAGASSRSGRVRSGAAQPRVGSGADGLPRRLDGHRWPAGRGEAQHPGEPPRTAAGVVNRAAQLKAYGNAVVPQVAALAWRVLSERATMAGAA